MSFTLSFSGSSVDADTSSCTLLFSTNLTNIGTILSAVFNYKSSLSSGTTKSVILPTNIDLANIAVPFAYGDYNTYYGSFTIKNAKRASYVFNYTPFNVSAAPGAPTLISLSTNPPDVSGIYDLSGNTTSSHPDYSQLWVKCNDYNKDLNGNPLGDVFRIDLYAQSSDPSSNLVDGQTGLYTYFKNFRNFSGCSYTASTKKIYIPGNVTALIDSSNQYITADEIYDTIKTSSVAYDASNNRTEITVNNRISTTSTNDNVQISSFLTGNSLNIGLTSVTDTMTGAVIPLVEDVNYTFFCEVARLTSFNVVDSANLYDAFYTNKINVPTNLSVSNNNTDDALVFNFTPPTDALTNGLHNIDSYILTYGATTTAATFDSTNFDATVFNSVYAGGIINSNVYAVTQLGLSAVNFWSDASAAYATTNYTINNGANVVGFQNATTIKGKTFQAGYIFGLTASGLKENGQVREYGKTGFYTVGSNGIIMKVNPRTIAVTVGAIAYNATTPLNKNNFNTTGSLVGSYIPITVTGRIGTYGFNDVALTKNPISLFLNDISLDSFDLSSNDYDASGVYTTNSLVTFTIKAYVSYISDFTSVNYGGVVKFGASLTDVNSNASSTIYLTSTSAAGVYNSAASVKANAFSYKLQDYPDYMGSVSLANYYYATRLNQTDYNYARLTWSNSSTDSKDGTVTGSKQRIVYNGAANPAGNTQDVSSNSLSTIFAADVAKSTDGSVSINATLQTYTNDLNKIVTGNNYIYNLTSVNSNSLSFPGIGMVTNLAFIQNPTYSLLPKVTFQFNDPSNAGIDPTKFAIDISYSSLTGEPLHFYPVSLTKNGNGSYSVTTQATNPAAPFYVPFTLGDGMTVTVTPTDIYGQTGTANTTSFAGTPGVDSLSATINDPFSEFPKITLTIQGGNGSYFIFADGVIDTPLTDVVSNTVTGTTKIVLQYADPSGANYLPFNWGENLEISLYTKDVVHGYLGKVKTTRVVGIQAVSGLTFLDNADINIVNPYLTVYFVAPDNLKSTDKFLITVNNTTSSSIAKFNNAPNSTGYRELTLIASTDVSGGYTFLTQSTNSSAANYLSFTWGDNINLTVQPIDTNNELGLNNTISLIGTTAVGNFNASINNVLTDLPEVTLTFNNNGIGSANYYASVTDASDVTILSEVVKSSVVGNTTTIILVNFTSDGSFNRVSTFEWGDTLIVRLYQKHASYVNYFGSVATSTITGKHMVRNLTFAPNDDINNVTPYVTVKFQEPDNIQTQYYFITVTNTTNYAITKYSNALVGNNYNNLTLSGPDASGNYKFKTQGNDSSGKNFLPFTFGEGLQVVVQAIDPNTNILSSINTITLPSLSAVSQLNPSINNMLTDTQQFTLTFTGGNGSYFISVFDASDNYTQNFENALSTTNNGVTTVVIANSASNPSTNSNYNYLQNFDWGDDLIIKLYQKDLNYSYLGAVATTEIVGEHMVQGLTFVNNSDYNTSTPYINVQFSYADNFQTNYYFITVTDLAHPSVHYKFCNAPTYNNYNTLVLTGPDASNNVFNFQTQSVSNSSDNYFPFVWGNNIKVSVQTVDPSTNELGAVNNITLTGTAAVANLQASINTPLSDIPEVTLSFAGGNGRYYASVTEGSVVTIFPDLIAGPSVNGVTTIVFSSDNTDSSANYLQVYDWGDTLTVNVYQKDAVYDHYLGAIATTVLTGKHMVSGLKFVPNHDINNVTPYVTVQFKEPDNLNTQYYFITVTNTSTTAVKKYSNAPYYDSLNNLTVDGPDASGNYTFKTQGVAGVDNFLPFTFGDGLQVSVQAVDSETNILSSPSTIVLPSLSAVSQLNTSINNMLTDTQQITLTFTGGNGAYYISVIDSSPLEEHIFIDALSTTSNGVTTIVLANSATNPSTNSNYNYLENFTWGDDLTVKVYQKYPNYSYLGAGATKQIIGAHMVQGLTFVNNSDYNTSNPYINVEFSAADNFQTDYYFITVISSASPTTPYKFSNAPSYNNYRGLTLTKNGSTYNLQTQSDSDSSDNYLSFVWGETLQVKVQPVNGDTNELGAVNSITLTGTVAVADLQSSINTPLLDIPEVTLSFTGGNGSYYASVTEGSVVTIFPDLIAGPSIDGVTKIVFSSDVTNSNANYLQVYDWGDTLTVNVYQKDAVYDHYLGAIATTDLTGKHAVSGLKFVPNADINNITPYITVQFKEPDNLNTQYYFINVTNTSTNAVKKYSNAPLEDSLNNLTVDGPDASGNYTFKTQGVEGVDNFLPFTFGDGLQVSVQAVDSQTNILSAPNTITLPSLSPVSNLSAIFNTPLTETPEITLTFTNGLGSYFISVFDSVSNHTQTFESANSTTDASGNTKIILVNSANSNSTVNNLEIYDWGDDLTIQLYQKDLNYSYLGAVATKLIVGADQVNNLNFIDNDDYHPTNPCFTFKFEGPTNIPTNYYFVTVSNTSNPSYAPYKFCNVPDNSFNHLTLDNSGNNTFIFRSQSFSDSSANYYPFAWGDSLQVSVRPIDPNTYEFGTENVVSLTGLTGPTSLISVANSEATEYAQLTLTFNSVTGGNFYLYAKNLNTNVSSSIYGEPLSIVTINGVYYLKLQSGDADADNYFDFNWGDNIELYLHARDSSTNRYGYLSRVNFLRISGGSAVKALKFLPNEDLNTNSPYVTIQFGKPQDDTTDYYLIKVSRETSAPVTFCNYSNYALDNLTLAGPDASENYVFITQQTDSTANNYFPFSWGDKLTVSVQSIDANNNLGQFASVLLPQSTKVRDLQITSNADMYYDSANQFHPYINFAFTTPSTGSPVGNQYIAYINVNNSPHTPITFSGNTVLTQSLNASSPNYLAFEYGDKIDIIVYPIVGTTNRLGAVSSSVTVDAASSIRNLQLVNNYSLDNAHPSISFKFMSPFDSISTNYQIIVQNDTNNQNTGMFTNLPGFGVGRENERGLRLTSDDTGYYFVFTSQSFAPGGDNYLNFNWGDAMTIYVTELDEHGNPGALPVNPLVIPAYNAPACSWIQNADISLNPYLSVLIDISGVDANAQGTVTSYDLVFTVNDTAHTYMIANIASGSISNGSINDATRYLQPVNGTTTQFTIKTQSTNPSKSNYLPFVWNDKVVLTVYPIVNNSSGEFTNRFGKASDYTQTTHSGTSAMTVTPVTNANYNISAPYITLNATYYSKYFVSITDSSNNFWSFTYDSSGNANSDATITTIITNNSIVPLTLRMRSLNITVSNLNVATNQLSNQRTITYDGVGSVTPTIVANATKNVLHGYLTVQFTAPTYGSVSTQNPYIISVAHVNSQTKSVFTTVYNNSESITDLSNNGTATFTNTAIVNLSDNTFTTQSFDSTKPNYLPFNWGDNYTVTVYPVNTYNYLGVSSTTSVNGMPSVKLTLLDTHTLQTPTVKVNVSGNSYYDLFYSNIVVNENSSNSVGPLYLTNYSVDSSNNITITSGDSCVNYPQSSVDAYGNTVDVVGDITAVNFIAADEVSIDVRTVNSLNHLSAEPVIPIAAPYRQPVLSRTKSTDSNGYDVVVRDISLNGQALIVYSFTDVYLAANNSISLKNWLLKFNVVTRNSHQYNNSNPSVSENASLSLEYISGDSTTFVSAADTTLYSQVLADLNINSITVTGNPYSGNNRAITSARITINYNTNSASTLRLAGSTANAIMSGQNNFAAETGFEGSN